MTQVQVKLYATSGKGFHFSISVHGRSRATLNLDAEGVAAVEARQAWEKFGAIAGREAGYHGEGFQERGVTSFDLKPYTLDMRPRKVQEAEGVQQAGMGGESSQPAEKWRPRRRLADLAGELPPEKVVAPRDPRPPSSSPPSGAAAARQPRLAARRLAARAGARAGGGEVVAPAPTTNAWAKSPPLRGGAARPAARHWRRRARAAPARAAADAAFTEALEKSAAEARAAAQARAAERAAARRRPRRRPRRRQRRGARRRRRPRRGPVFATHRLARWLAGLHRLHPPHVDPRHRRPRLPWRSTLPPRHRCPCRRPRAPAPAPAALVTGGRRIWDEDAQSFVVAARAAADGAAGHAVLRREAGGGGARRCRRGPSH